MPKTDINSVRISPHFLLSEFHCRCCGAVMIFPELLERLEYLRGLWGRPLVITSGYRCKSHNGAVGGVQNSLHCRGLAADVSLAAFIPAEWNILKECAKTTGFTEVILNMEKKYMHLACKL
jgi:hypothetical protein